MRSPPPPDGSLVPRYLSSFIGRERQIEEVMALLTHSDVRLLTLLGPGGAGKTRLAVETVNRLPPGIFEYVWFISLASVRDSHLVVSSITRSVGVTQVGEQTAEDALIRFLRQRVALLVIDNFETVVTAGASLGRILAACPRITILVTSRIALRVSGEHVMSIPPLDLPTAGNLAPERLLEVDSVRLFVERARAAASRFALTESNAAPIAGICRRLDGLPLALELAAARISLLSPPALLNLLERRLAVLGDGPRDAPDRQRSLRDTIAWSYDLLGDTEQAAFRQLSVFNGGFGLEAAQAVANHHGEMLEMLASLTSKSLIVPATSDDAEPRFTMLETLREYGLERLAATGEQAATRNRHAAFYLEEAIQGEYAWCMYLPQGLHWLSRLATDHGNMQEALQWLYESGDITRCLRMAGALAPLWIVCGNMEEGRTWLEHLLADSRVVDDVVRANGLATLSWISNEQNRADRAFELAEEVIALSQEIDIPLDAIRGHALSGVAAPDLGQYDLAQQRLEAAIELMRTPGMPDWIQNFIQNSTAMLGYVELRRGDLTSAEARFNEATAHDRARGYEPGTSYILGSNVLSGLMWVTRAKGDVVRALEYAQQHLRLNTGYHNVNFIIHGICDVGGALAALGQYILAARLFGASEALMEMYGYDFTEAFDIQRAAGLPEPWARESEPCGIYEALRDALRPRAIPSLPASITVEALERAWVEGRTMSLDAAVAQALAATATPGQETTPRSGQHLTSRQKEVLRLLADGRSNRAIAETLSLSERTVEHHIMHILARLGVESRTAAATHAVREGLI